MKDWGGFFGVLYFGHWTSPPSPLPAAILHQPALKEQPGVNPSPQVLAMDLPFMDPGLTAPAFSKQWEWHWPPPSEPRPRGAVSF